MVRYFEFENNLQMVHDEDSVAVVLYRMVVEVVGNILVIVIDHHDLQKENDYSIWIYWIT